ncbi:hypothetical protein K523DRAFT_152114 [Schizophyllum commune Tattone D]|nr:hypothetical protein K523DRAFT_152114 [Schizophyllum commune Tattone D]
MGEERVVSPSMPLPPPHPPCANLPSSLAQQIPCISTRAPSLFLTPTSPSSYLRLPFFLLQLPSPSSSRTPSYPALTSSSALSETCCRCRGRDWKSAETVGGRRRRARRRGEGRGDERRGEGICGREGD